MAKYREIVIRTHVKLPPLSTEIPAREHSFLAFLAEWVQGAKKMRDDDKLEHRLEWDDVLEAFMRRMAEKAGVEEPAPAGADLKAPLPLRVTADQATHERHERELSEYRQRVQDADRVDAEAWAAYSTAVHQAAVGESLYVTDAAYKSAKEAAKAALDEALTPDPMGRTRLPRAYEPKILRHYHAFTQAQALEEKDIPKAPASKAEPPATAPETPSKKRRAA